jgi:hypothetical protein
VGVDAAGAEAVCDLKLRDLGSLVVRVAADAGGGSKGLRVSLDGPPWSEQFVHPAEEGGATVFRALDPGAWALHVAAEGWTAVERAVRIAGGERTEVAVRLGAGAVAEGVVVDDRGVPVSGVTVYASPRNPSQPDLRLPGDRDQSAGTDASGAFRVTGLPAGPVDLCAGGAGYITSDRVRRTVPCGGLRLEIAREPTLLVRVDAPPGTTLPTTVRATVVRLAGRLAGHRLRQDVFVGEHPTALKRVEPGPCEVIVEAPGFAPSKVTVDVLPGETVTAGPFAFEPGIALAGRVVDGGGAPVAGAVVVPYENERRAGTSDAAGRFVLPDLSPGPVDLQVKAAGFPETILMPSVLPDGPPLEIVLRPGGIVRGTVSSRSGARVERAGWCVCLAEWKDAYGPHWDVRVDGAPQFSLRLPAGRYRLVPNRYDFGKDNVLFDVTDGGETGVDLVLPW